MADAVGVYGTSQSEMYRVNRFTGTKEYSTDDGWLTLDQMHVMRQQRHQNYLAEQVKAIKLQASDKKIIGASLVRNDPLKVYYADGTYDLWVDPNDKAVLSKALSDNSIQIRRD